MRRVNWSRVVGGVLSATVILTALGLADRFDHYLIAIVANVVIGLILAGVEAWEAEAVQ